MGIKRLSLKGQLLFDLNFYSGTLGFFSKGSIERKDYQQEANECNPIESQAAPNSFLAHSSPPNSIGLSFYEWIFLRSTFVKTKYRIKS